MRKKEAGVHRGPRSFRIHHLFAVAFFAIAGAAANASQNSTGYALVEAAGRGNLAEVQALLVAGADAGFKPRSGGSALSRASSGGHLEVVRALLAAKPDLRGALGGEAVFEAAAKNQQEILRALLEAGAPVNFTFADESGGTALYHAATNGRTDILRILLAAGADPSPVWQFGGGRSALFSAVMGGQLDAALLLLEAGADGNRSTSYGATPLYLAAGGNTAKHLAVVRALIASRVDVDAGHPPRFKAHACQPIQLAQLAQALPEIVQPPAPADGTEARPAGQDGRGSCTQALRSAEGTALGMAVGGGNAQIVQALLDARVRVDARQPGWKTPLMIASAAGRVDLVRLLLDAGADASLTDSDDRTALMLAQEKGHQEVAALLRR